MNLENETTINCAYDEMVNVCDLKVHPRNPNIHPPSQIKLLAKALVIHGWRAPITVSTSSGYIIRGHCRLYAAKELGIGKVPVDFQDYESENHELSDLVADNSLSGLSDFDNEMIQNIIGGLDDNLSEIISCEFINDETRDDLDKETDFDLDSPIYDETEKESIRLVFYKKDREEIILAIREIINKFKGTSYYG